MGGLCGRAGAEAGGFLAFRKGRKRMKKKIRVGSRESRLAVAQTEEILEEVRAFHPELEFELVTMKTTGDKILDRNLDQIGGKGLFVKELDKALLEGRVDLTIHSLKDLPMEESEELPIIGYSKRKDPRDIMILREKEMRAEEISVIGTSSKRRKVQLQRLYAQAEFRGIRGNVQTRLKKLSEEGYDATILAMAGLSRLGMEHLADRIFSVDELIPAAGQGILVLQGRKGENYAFLEEVCDRDSKYAALAERAFVRKLDGGCSSPVAAYAEIKEKRILLRGLYYDEAEGDYIVGKKEGSIDEAQELGLSLAEELKESYAKKKGYLIKKEAKESK